MLRERQHFLGGVRISAHVGRVYIKDGRKSQIGSGSPLVTMMQPPESFMRKDTTGSCRANPSPRRFHLESKMSSVLVIVADIIREESLQMLPVDRNHVIEQIVQALSTQRSATPFCQGL
jgi:hypothetical protein